MSRGAEDISANIELETITSDSIQAAASIYQKLQKHWELYLLVLPPVLYLLIFKYIPMVGVQIAFKDFSVVKGIWGSPWVGLKHFEAFFNSPNFWLLIKNTIGISFYSLIAGFPIPILLALALNEIRTGYFKRPYRWSPMHPILSPPLSWYPSSF